MSSSLLRVQIVNNTIDDVKYEILNPTTSALLKLTFPNGFSFQYKRHIDEVASKGVELVSKKKSLRNSRRNFNNVIDRNEYKSKREEHYTCYGNGWVLYRPNQRSYIYPMIFRDNRKIKFMNDSLCLVLGDFKIELTRSAFRRTMFKSSYDRELQLNPTAKLGYVFLSVFGPVMEIEVSERVPLKVQRQYLIAVPEGVTYDFEEDQDQKKKRSINSSNLFEFDSVRGHYILQGPGKVLIQSRARGDLDYEDQITNTS